MNATASMSEWCELAQHAETPTVPAWVPDDAAVAAHFGKSLIHSRYKVLLAKSLAALLPCKGRLSILDVGAGEGLLGAFFQKYRPETIVNGLETFVRINDPPIPLRAYSGRDLPFHSASWDVVLFSNVLHHTADQQQLINEAARVGRRQILIKDHVFESAMGWAKLVALDVLGNLRFGVATTADYLRRDQWRELFGRAGIRHADEYAALPFREGVLARLFENDLEVIFAAHLTTA